MYFPEAQIICITVLFIEIIYELTQSYASESEEKAMKQIETITRQKQSAENKLVIAKKRMESAKLIVELYS